MLPSVKFLGMDMYTWFLLIGILAAIVFFRLLTDRMKLDTKVFNFSLIVTIVAIVFAYLSAVLFQSWYDYLETGTWEWGSGATFYGGLIGAIVSFLLCYFIAGHFIFKDKRHIRNFNLVLSSVMPCIALAHGFGRIGCLFAGCCHGRETDSWIGIVMNGSKVVPLQLFEAIFLFALFLVLVYLLIKKRNEYTASIYLIAYGVWRFIIEYWRDDDRGSSGIDWLTPSQLTAIIMVILGIAVILLYKFMFKRILENAGTTIKETEPKVEETEQ